jgi:hypothetical protein
MPRASGQLDSVSALIPNDWLIATVSAWLSCAAFSAVQIYIRWRYALGQRFAGANLLGRFGPELTDQGWVLLLYS